MAQKIGAFRAVGRKTAAGNFMGFMTTAAGILFLAAVSSCGDKPGQDAQKKQFIQNSGSDTMVNLAQLWAEEYKKVVPDVSVEVGGGGSSVGIRDLTQGIADIANCSRDMTASELEQAERNTGKRPVEWVVGYDAMAIYAHKDNPIETLTLEELAEIYGEGGKVDLWSQLEVDNKKLCPSDEVVRVSRQNSSGTYAYFREVVLHKKDFKLNSRDMSGSKDVVELVGHTPCAIGYSGMGYKTDDVKFVKIASKKGGEAYSPTLENVLAKKYPLARSLNMYTLGKPEGQVKAYIDWILSPQGQEIVEKSGYIPVSAVQDK